jgi:hypothetical protein
MITITGKTALIQPHDKKILEIKNGVIWTELIWLRIGTSGGGLM